MPTEIRGPANREPPAKIKPAINFVFITPPSTRPIRCTAAANPGCLKTLAETPQPGWQQPRLVVFGRATPYAPRMPHALQCFNDKIRAPDRDRGRFTGSG